MMMESPFCLLQKLSVVVGAKMEGGMCILVLFVLLYFGNSEWSNRQAVLGLNFVKRTKNRILCLLLTKRQEFFIALFSSLSF